ncbi:MAG: hypothetical protein AVDCRST_MAG33-1301, partial [uncultured Thermomicrobiales bacterium]
GYLASGDLRCHALRRGSGCRAAVLPGCLRSAGRVRGRRLGGVPVWGDAHQSAQRHRGARVDRPSHGGVARGGVPRAVHHHGGRRRRDVCRTDRARGRPAQRPDGSPLGHPDGELPGPRRPHLGDRLL